MQHVIRELSSEDLPSLRAFLGQVPARDHTFLKEDPTDPEVVQRWLEDKPVIRRIAVDDDEIVAAAALRAGIGRMSHVADLRLVVGTTARRHGIGGAMARRMLLEALRTGFRKVTVDVEATSPEVIEMFQRLGFQPEALLRDQLRDADDRYCDLVVLAHAVDEQWAAMASAGIGDALR